MNKYEMLYIIDNDVQDEQKEVVINRLSDVVTNAGGVVECKGSPTIGHVFRTAEKQLKIVLTHPGTRPLATRGQCRALDGSASASTIC